MSGIAPKDQQDRAVEPGSPDSPEALALAAYPHFSLTPCDWRHTLKTSAEIMSGRIGPNARSKS
jgi:hypothetical protein